MNNIILIGGGGHAKSCIDVIELEKKYKICGVIDSYKSKKKILGYKIIGSDKNLKNFIKTYKYALISVGQIKDYSLRKRLYNKALSAGFKLPKIISPLSYVSKHASIGSGTIIMHGVTINAGVKIGKNCIINTRALIEHDTKIGDNCHISTGTILNGGCEIKNETFIGSKSVTKENITIGTKCVVGAGCTIMKDLKSNTIFRYRK